jgi:PTS system nitrogen regulatory IIA component
MFSDDSFRQALATDPDPRSVYRRIVNWQPSLQAAG